MPSRRWYCKYIIHIQKGSLELLHYYITSMYDSACMLVQGHSNLVSRSENLTNLVMQISNSQFSGLPNGLQDQCELVFFTANTTDLPWFKKTAVSWSPSGAQFHHSIPLFHSIVPFHHSIPPNQDTVATVIRRDKLNSQLIIVTKFLILHAGGHGQSLFRFQTSRELECRWLCSSSSAYHIHRATAMTSFLLHFCMANWNSITHFVEPALRFFHDKLETCIQVYAYNMCYSSTDWVVVVVPGGGVRWGAVYTAVYMFQFYADVKFYSLEPRQWYQRIWLN